MAKEYRTVGKCGITIPNGFDWPREPFVFLDLSGSHVIIEEGTTFSSGVKVLTHSHHFNKSNWRDMSTITNSKPTVFHKFCFIGVDAIILNKCKSIGAYSVIGAGSVLNRDVPPYEIWAGNPAIKIGDVDNVCR